MAIRAILAGGVSRDVLLSSEDEKIKELEHQEELGKVEPGTASQYRATAASFDLRVLDGTERARLQNFETPAQDHFLGTYRQNQFGDAIRYACLRGIVGWKNVLDDHGDPVEFIGRKSEKGSVVGATLVDIDRLDIDTCASLYRQIRDLLSVRTVDFLGESVSAPTAT